jgi:hypothetical protein
MSRNDDKVADSLFRAVRTEWLNLLHRMIEFQSHFQDLDQFMEQSAFDARAQKIQESTRIFSEAFPDSSLKKVEVSSSSKPDRKRKSTSSADSSKAEKEKNVGILIQVIVLHILHYSKQDKFKFLLCCLKQF